MRILIESSGSLTSNYLLKSIKKIGFQVVGSDIDEFNHSKVLCDDFIKMPKANDRLLWKKIENLLINYKIDVVIPSFDESLLGWSERIDQFNDKKIKVIISSAETIRICQDKWLTYKFFRSIGINTPNTSLTADFELLKPRRGRGGKGILENNFKKKKIDKSMISQQKISGKEYTVDVFFQNNGKPFYIIPRLRINILDGKSTKGIVVKNNKINEQIKKISEKISFIGPVNFQLFETKDKELLFIEINPRIAGGMALGFAASENWISLINKNIINKKKNYSKTNKIWSTNDEVL